MVFTSRRVCLRGRAVQGFKVLGNASAIVPVIVGYSTVAREMTNAMLTGGAIVNLVEAPAVAKNQSRWRLQVMADQDDDTMCISAESGHGAPEVDGMPFVLLRLLHGQPWSCFWCFIKSPKDFHNLAAEPGPRDGLPSVCSHEPFRPCRLSKPRRVHTP